MTLLLLALLLTCLGLGLYLTIPGAPLALPRAGVLLLAGAGAGLVALLLPMTGDTWGWFIGFTLVGLWSAVRVVTHAKAVYCALYFVLLVVAVTGLLVLADAEFLAAALLIIYAGAILVTYVFVIMLAQQAGGPARYDREAREPLLGIFTGLVLIAAISIRIMTGTWARPGGESGAALAAGVSEVGKHLLTNYAVGVEIAGVLLLAAMVGAIVIARRRAVDMDAEEAA